MVLKGKSMILVYKYIWGNKLRETAIKVWLFYLMFNLVNVLLLTSPSQRERKSLFYVSRFLNSVHGRFTDVFLQFLCCTLRSNSSDPLPPLKCMAAREKFSNLLIKINLLNWKLYFVGVCWLNNFGNYINLTLYVIWN